MKVTEQIDALRAIGVNYIKKLIVPRLMAALLVFPLVTILADGMGLVGGMLIAVFDRNVDPYLYWNTIAYWVVLKDFLTGIGKSVVFGALVTLIGCYNGLATEGGTEGLGRSTTATWHRVRSRATSFQLSISAKASLPTISSIRSSGCRSRRPATVSTV